MQECVLHCAQNHISSWLLAVLPTSLVLPHWLHVEASPFGIHRVRGPAQAEHFSKLGLMLLCGSFSKLALMLLCRSCRDVLPLPLAREFVDSSPSETRQRGKESAF